MTGKRKRESDENSKEDLRGEVRRLRKQVAQLKRELEKAQGVLNWGWLDDSDESVCALPTKILGSKDKELSGNKGKGPSDSVSQGGSPRNACPKCGQELINLEKPDGSILTRCGKCAYKKRK